ncbi:MAG: response regulator transcription factor [Chloroflexi bacterium]|jgi:two-component system response regulator MprA|nr:response regulator transcription factor [Chloroflexota bacterium]HLG50906.1 response regulator transcription factor [Chloroflexota bacterium]
MKERILVIDDDEAITTALRRMLSFEGYTVEVALDGEEGLRKVREAIPDLIILDILMPGIDGVEVCRRLRSTEDVPILMLTARDEVADRVRGLDAGADDYLVKPFAPDELLARVRALLRRRDPRGRSATLRFADLTVETRTRQVFRGDREIKLSAKEFDLLAYFARHPRQVLTREQLLEAVWGYAFDGESNIVDVYVGYLRQKLEARNEPRLIHTVRGVGFVLRE